MAQLLRLIADFMEPEDKQKWADSCFVSTNRSSATSWCFSEIQIQTKPGNS
jgi:hypothetical protein